MKNEKSKRNIWKPNSVRTRFTLDVYRELTDYSQVSVEIEGQVVSLVRNEATKGDPNNGRLVRRKIVKISRNAYPLNVAT